MILLTCLLLSHKIFFCTFETAIVDYLLCFILYAAILFIKLCSKHLNFEVNFEDIFEVNFEDILLRSSKRQLPGASPCR